jgi:hypothetical protein
MATPMEVQAKFTKVFNERVSSLLADKYCKRLDTRLSHFWIVRLKHMANGNEVVLRGYPMEGLIVQTTNNIVTHKEHIL